jgi:hypothetical protein
MPLLSICRFSFVLAITDLGQGALANITPNVNAQTKEGKTEDLIDARQHIRGATIS